MLFRSMFRLWRLFAKDACGFAGGRSFVVCSGFPMRWKADHFPSGGFKAFLVGTHPVEHHADIVAALLCVLGAVPVDFGKNLVFRVHGSGCHQFRGSANVGALHSCGGASALDAGADAVIVDVPAVPCEQEFHAVRGSEGDVAGIVRSYSRDNLVTEQAAGEFLGLDGGTEQRESGEICKGGP